MVIAPEHIHTSAYFNKVLCEPGWKWDIRSRPMSDYDLWYVWDGTGDLELNGSAYKVQRGSCFLFRPGDRIFACHDPDRPLTVSYIHFHCKVPQLEKTPSYLLLYEDVWFEGLLERYMSQMLAQEEGFRHEASLLIVMLLFQYSRHAASASNRHMQEPAQRTTVTDAIWKIASGIRQHPAMHRRIRDLAREAHLSPRYFSLKFKEVVGLSCEQYMVECRIQRAEYLLRYSGMSVSEVADALGYQNIYYFSRQFKKYRGIAPSRLLKS
ncbi:AraC family transcriptional regulator [Paenibacillus sp. J5C_2022]|uniref:AraC family transcriptional regulator n=1 Tax=Paenibacillus sp. J5C2022 TaxID=2977129 RepID=UPI0021D2F5F6|nr:AraC family transcriptional regulator [Paenibacillus sp. J5C2022]MCU6710838.1 AraC family transcriptional regulator [Paenibacillus sp. J5C2022]